MMEKVCSKLSYGEPQSRARCVVDQGYYEAQVEEASTRPGSLGSAFCVDITLPHTFSDFLDYIPTWATAI